MATDETIAAEEFELAAARLDWVRADRCLDLPAQREALEWHVACCKAALAAVDRKAGKEPVDARKSEDPTSRGATVAGKNKGGREARKPKQEQNKKPKGQTPPPGGVQNAVKTEPRNSSR